MLRLDTDTSFCTLPSTSLIKQISSTHQKNIPALKWGRNNEEIACKTYSERQTAGHSGFKCSVTGLVVNQLYPHLGASICVQNSIGGKGSDSFHLMVKPPFCFQVTCSRYSDSVLVTLKVEKTFGFMSASDSVADTHTPHIHTYTHKTTNPCCACTPRVNRCMTPQQKRIPCLERSL